MTTPHLHIVIEGIGNVVQDYYARPLREVCRYHSGKVKVTFVDKSIHWRNDSNISDDYKRFVKSIKDWAIYINKSTRRGLKEYKKLNADVVFIATPDYTHIDLVLDHWLEPVGRCQRIFIEKPLDVSLDKARDLLSRIPENDPKVRALDHYRARMLPIIISPLQYTHILKDLGGRITGFNFYFLEDGSDGLRSVGPIENKGRANAVQHGLIMDMMPHVPAILSNFGIVDSIRVLGVRAGRYTFTDKDGTVKDAAIPNETFGHVKFSFRGFDLKPIIGEAFVGKGIGGSHVLEMRGAVKLLELHGKNGNKYHFDLRSSNDGGKVTLIKKSKSKKSKRFYLTELYRDAYGTLIKKVVEQRLENSDDLLWFDMPVELAKNILISIEEMRHPLKKVNLLPTYHINPPDEKGSGAPYLEDVIKILAPIQPFF